MKLRYELDDAHRWLEFACKLLPANTGTHEDLIQVLRQVCEAEGELSKRDFKWLWMKLFNREGRRL